MHLKWISCQNSKKLKMGVAVFFLKFFQKKNFGEVPDPFVLPTRRNLNYLEKNGILKFFERVICPC